MPKDPVMLLSFVNMRLRDNGYSLEELCKSEGEEVSEVIKRLEAIDYHYDETQNKFV